MTVKARMFLGIALSKKLQKALDMLNPAFVQLFVHSADPDNDIENVQHLQRIVFKDVAYLGKYIEGAVDLGEIALLEKNIKSILVRVLPNYNFEDVTLELIAI